MKIKIGKKIKEEKKVEKDEKVEELKIETKKEAAAPSTSVKIEKIGKKKKVAAKTELPSGTRDIGVPVSNFPKEKCNDERCPWHGSLKIRGRIFSGTVISDKAPLTVIVEWPFLRKIRKYERYMKKTSRVAAYNPSCIHAIAGEKVRIAECRPLSKTKHFVVIEKIGD